MGRGEDVSSIAAECKEAARFGDDIIHAAVWECFLRAQAAEETQFSAILLQQLTNVHYFRLERIEAVQANVNKVIKQLVNVAA